MNRQAAERFLTAKYAEYANLVIYTNTTRRALNAFQKYFCRFSGYDFCSFFP
jgi:hypothetical protein